MKILHSFLRFAALALCVAGVVLPVSADEVTPSGGPREVPEAAAATAAGQRPRINYADAAAQVAAVYPLTLDQMSQVFQNSHNWRGAEDASLRCEIGFTADALVLRGEFVDDLPFHQTMLRPAMPDWWRITYGADGLEFCFDDPTSATNRVRLALNFGSRAVNPTVDLLHSPLGVKPGPIPTASLELFDAPSPAGADASGKTAIGFEAAIPMADLADPRLFAGPLRITLRMHDMDGGPSTYLMLQQVIEKK